MADPLFGHEAHTFVNAMIGRDVEDPTGKDITHSRALGGTPLENYFPGIIAFGNDANELVILGHQQGTDILVSHHLDRGEYRLLRGNCPDCFALVTQHLAYSAFECH